ncbi:MAG: SDR family oxidoreductase [Candidatus Omnitrophica bacterium]|nr:SDR family oxidoreductase [Candidatus Omnitrophota bacterium]
MQEDSYRFLVIGSRGLIGKAVINALGDIPFKGTFSGKDCPEGLLRLNLLEPDSIKRTIDEYRPTHIIHCANFSGGARVCEKNSDEARKFHFEATKVIGQECLSKNIRFVFISTECVFDGAKEEYFEDDPLNPLNVYGKGKADSELWIRENLSDYIIARTMFVFGWQPETTTPNAMMSAYFALRNHKKIQVPTFRWGTPTQADNLARALVEMAKSEENGVFHVSGKTFCNRYQWIKEICQELGWNESLVEPINEDKNHEVQYPHRIRLNTDKFLLRFKTKLLTLHESLQEIKRQYE